MAGSVRYSLLTSYAAGAIPWLPFRIHLLVDFALGIVMLAAPFVFGVTTFYVVIGIGIVLFVAATQPDDGVLQ